MSEVKQGRVSHKELAGRLGITESEMIAWSYKAILVQQLHKLGLKSKIRFRVKPGTIDIPS